MVSETLKLAYPPPGIATYVACGSSFAITRPSVAGLTAFLVENGLPRLHHPLFAVQGFERASQDRFWLMLARPDAFAEQQQAIDWLRQTGAVSVHEVDT